MQPFDRLVRHVVRQVVGILGVLVVVGLRSADDLLVLRQARIPLARAAAEEAVEVVEPPADRPAVERAGRALLAVRGQVPLAERRGAVPVVAQDPRERDAVVREEARVAREAGRELAHRADADRVAVATGQERGPRRRAERGDVEAVVAQALLRHPACSSAFRSGRRRSRGCRSRHRRSAPAGHSARRREARRDRSGSQSGCDPSSVRFATPLKGGMLIGSLLLSGWLIVSSGVLAG